MLSILLYIYPKVELLGHVARSNQSILKEIRTGIFIGRIDAEAPILWPPDVRN